MAQQSGAATKKKRAAEEPQELTREEMILKHMPLVRAIAGRVRDGLPVQVELDDLVHAGVLGLFDAVDKYKPDKNVVFHLYAKHRIRGAILDSLRQLDWASRDLRKRYKSFEAAANEQAQRLGRAPNETEVAQAMGMSEDQYFQQKRELHRAGLNPAKPHVVEKPDHPGFVEATDPLDRQPDSIFANSELRGALEGALETLPPRYRTVIRLYYDRDRTMKQIGATLGVNESRVSQIHKAALQKLAVALRGSGYDAGAFLEDAGAA